MVDEIVGALDSAISRAFAPYLTSGDDERAASEFLRYGEMYSLPRATILLHMTSAIEFADVATESLKLIDDLIARDSILAADDEASVRLAIRRHHQTTERLLRFVAQRRPVHKQPSGLLLNAAYLDFCFTGLALTSEGTVENAKPERLRYLCRVAPHYAQQSDAAVRVMYGDDDPRPDPIGAWSAHADEVLASLRYLSGDDSD